jgi:hypothetical protein
MRSENQFVDIQNITKVHITCSENHEESISLGDAAFEEVIAKFQFEHAHSTSSAAGMREDLQNLSKLLTKLCRKDFAEIKDILNRRKIKVEFETKPVAK